jgi:hypothetical protein
MFAKGKAPMFRTPAPPPSTTEVAVRLLDVNIDFEHMWSCSSAPSTELNSSSRLAVRLPPACRTSTRAAADDAILIDTAGGDQLMPPSHSILRKCTSLSLNGSEDNADTALWSKLQSLHLSDRLLRAPRCSQPPSKHPAG